MALAWEEEVFITSSDWKGTHNRGKGPTDIPTKLSTHNPADVIEIRWEDTRVVLSRSPCNAGNRGYPATCFAEQACALRESARTP